MNKNVIIGNSCVQIRGLELLPTPLAGLARLACSGIPEEAILDVETRAKRDWPLDVVEKNGTHCFGRPNYAMEVTPDSRKIRLLFAAEPESDDLYWLQRDIFGVLACMAGELMLHCSAVISPDGSAWAFCGASGVGKSTICSLLMSEGFHAINDEVNWLFFGDAKAASSGSQSANGVRPSFPVHIVNQRYWLGAEEEPYLPVTRICLLQQARQCVFRPAPPKSETFVRLLAAHLSIDTQYDFLRKRSEALLRLLETDIMQTLEFNLDAKELRDLLWTNASHKDC